MKQFATLFCHVSDGLSEANTQNELQRQHDTLEQYARLNNLPIDHCFFHVGNYDFENPDDVLLRFLQCAQEGNLGLVLIERVGIFPPAQQVHTPQMEIHLVQEGICETIGCADAHIAVEESQPATAYMYWGL